MNDQSQVMNDPSQPRWYVVYTRPRWEKKVAGLLEKKQLEHYCPLNKVVRQWHDRKKTLMEPLFTSYVFVRATPKQHSYIKAISGVVNFIHWLGRPAVVRDEEIQSVKDFLGEHNSVAVEKISVSLHDTVKIVRGPFMHQEGKIIQVTNNTVKIELPSMGYALVAKVSRTHIALSSEQPAISQELAAQSPKLTARG
ncbi:MAG: UpxY family transcription antiterminator [Sphingobacteriales bacterium]|nr:UpxY family transcription antiterminator [Sphingobacteriales bacterium]